jgi:Flp pilus assembly protein TadD
MKLTVTSSSLRRSSWLKSYLLIECAVLLSLATWAGFAAAQSPVYRCQGNEYVASVKDSKNGNCKIMEGGNVTVVQGTRVNNPAAGSDIVKVAAVSPKVSSGGTRTESSTEQRSRDSDSRAILESELKRAESKQAELLKEYNNGEPEKNALDLKNPQRYIDRVAELKANIARNDSDIAGIKRELGRNVSASTAKSN